MTRTNRRPLLTLALAAAFALAPVLPALAAPADAPAGAWSGFTIWIEEFVLKVVAWGASDGETFPFLDPDGVSAGPGDQGDTYPFIDPNGLASASGAQEVPPNGGGETYPYLDPNGVAQEAPPDGGGDTYPFLDPDG